MKCKTNYARNMAVAIDLHETGLALMKLKIAREMPNASPEAREARWRRWLYREDDPIPGDVAGAVHVRPNLP